MADFSFLPQGHVPLLSNPPQPEGDEMREESEAVPVTSVPVKDDGAGQASGADAGGRPSTDDDDDDD